MAEGNFSFYLCYIKCHFHYKILNSFSFHVQNDRSFKGNLTICSQRLEIPHGDYGQVVWHEVTVQEEFSRIENLSFPYFSKCEVDLYKEVL